MRKSCKLCAIKHVAQASVLFDEALLGYPTHRLLAFGHLAEAESELLEPTTVAMAETIRNERVKAMEDPEYHIACLDILDTLTLIPDSP